jgi:hypothetical protein
MRARGGVGLCGKRGVIGTRVEVVFPRGREVFVVGAGVVVDIPWVSSAIREPLDSAMRPSIRPSSLDAP